MEVGEGKRERECDRERRGELGRVSRRGSERSGSGIEDVGDESCDVDGGSLVAADESMGEKGAEFGSVRLFLGETSLDEEDKVVAESLRLQDLGGIAVNDALELLEDGVPGRVGEATVGDLDEGDAETPDIAANVVLLGEGESLGRHVGLASGVASFGDAVHQLTGDPEVAELDSPLPVKQDVGRLDVSVNDLEALLEV